MCKHRGRQDHGFPASSPALLGSVMHVIHKNKAATVPSFWTSPGRPGGSAPEGRLAGTGPQVPVPDSGEWREGNCDEGRELSLMPCLHSQTANR